MMTILPRKVGQSTPHHTMPITVKLLMKEAEEKVSTPMKRIALFPSSTAMEPVSACLMSTTTLRPSNLTVLSAPMSDTWLSKLLFASAS